MNEWDETAGKVEITRLVTDFEKAKSDGRYSRFSEEETKKDFILPLFKALGWRVNSAEVSAEERILRGRADYGFKIDGVTKFYVEAKPLSTNIWERQFLQQVIDYSYAKGVSWAVLTNFGRTVVLYSENKEPNPFNSRFLDLSADKYLIEFDRLRLLSRAAVVNKELDANAEAFGRKPRKQPIDKQLLQDLNSFRLNLAKDIQRLNGERFRESDVALEETVQRILDRLIFIRVAEDRGLEDRQLALLSRVSESTVLRRLRELFARYDENFDSKLFQAHTADDVRIDGEVLQRVLRGLHETEDGAIRYDFGAIDADVLGVMYEQYLGLILRQTAKRTKLQDGAVSRKEQGIYYTPTWVVDYIVRVAIEEALKRKGAKAEKLRILDLSCGSGTFLLRAFDHIIRARNPRGVSVQSKFDPDTAGPLIALRASVLTDNLFGVDLDPRAVEIAQLNLMIRAAESRHRLPTIEKNVRVGNSLVSDVEVDRTAVDWTTEFPQIGGDKFDVIVGNPPYVRIQTLSNELVDYYNSTFSSAVGDYDIYILFIEQALKLLREGGVAGFILPNKFLTAKYGTKLRSLLAREGVLFKLLNFGDYQVFDGATTYTCLLFLRKGQRPNFAYGAFVEQSDPRVTRTLSDADFEMSKVNPPIPPNRAWTFVRSQSKPLFDRLDAEYPKLGEISSDIFQGFRTGCDNVFIIRPESEDNELATCHSELLSRKFQIETAILRRIVRGDEITRWSPAWGGQMVIFPYSVKGTEVSLIPLVEFRRRYPRAFDYLHAHEQWLKERERGTMAKEENWHQFSRPQNLDKLGASKLLVQEISSRNRICLDDAGVYCFITGYGIRLSDTSRSNSLFVEGVLNSRTSEFFHHAASTRLRGGFYSYRAQFLRPLPVPIAGKGERTQIANAAEALNVAHSRLRQLVEGTDRYHESLAAIEGLEAQLDTLTLDLFGITPKEEKVLPPLYRGSGHI